MDLSHFTALVIFLGYLGVFSYGLFFYFHHRNNGVPQGRVSAALSVALAGIPWIFFYAPRAFGQAEFSTFWQTMSRAGHFITICALYFVLWILTAYVSNGKK